MIQDEATICRFCGRELNKPKVAQQVTPKKKKMSTGCCLGLAILTVVIGFIVIIGLGVSSGGGPKPTPGPDKIGAFIICQQFVNKNLKAPKTADFASYKADKVTQINDNSFKVISYVDAENSFGALLRINYICEVTYIGNDQWHLDNLTTEP